MASYESLRIVFVARIYVVLAGALTLATWVILTWLDEYLFFQPILIFDVPPTRIPNFSLVVLISVLSGIAISMNIFRLARLRRSFGRSGRTGLTGSTVAFIAGVCGCNSVGFAIISLLGTAGGLATSFVSNYQLPLRILSVVLLIASLYSVSRSIVKECQVPVRPLVKIAYPSNLLFLAYSVVSFFGSFLTNFSTIQLTNLVVVTLYGSFGLSRLRKWF